ncbi:MAG TPA: fumarylacetoacetate hydrolase family protein, partial [Dongiaceae bacterium]
MMPPAAIGECARFIADLRQRRNGRRPPIEEIPADFRPGDLEEAYAVQEAARPLIAAAGRGEPVGWKIGSTSPPMQAALGIPFPCAGTLYAGTVQRGQARMIRTEYSKPGLECEIAVRLGANLAARAGGHNRASVLPAVAAVMTSVELVEWRFVDFKRAGVPSLVADDFFSCGCALGPEKPAAVLAGDADIAGRFTFDGEVASAGNARDILGHPLNSLAWLADHCAGRGTPLRAGEIVTLGSIVAAFRPDRPGRV